MNSKLQSLSYPLFDGRDAFESYLERFQRFAQTNEWNQWDWGTYLDALLTERALREKHTKNLKITKKYRRYIWWFKESKTGAGGSPDQYLEKNWCKSRQMDWTIKYSKILRRIEWALHYWSVYETQPMEISVFSHEIFI